MKNVFLEVINSVNLVNKKMNDNMKSLFSKYIKLLAVLLLSIAGVGQAWGTAIADLNFSEPTSLPNYTLSSSNTPTFTTFQGEKCVNVASGGGSSAPTFSANNSSAPTGGKRWIAFQPDVDCTVTLRVAKANDSRTFYLLDKDHASTSSNVSSYSPSSKNAWHETWTVSLTAGTWYALISSGSNFYVSSMQFVASGGASCSEPTSPSISGITAYTVGDNISLTASATGTSGTTTYTWYKGADWATASASSPVQATSTSGATFSKASCVVGDAGTYWCNISNGTGCDVQVSKEITVSAPPACADPTPTISASPNKTVICSAGSPTSLELTASDYEPGATLQWYKDRVSLTGQTSATLTVSAAGSYVVKATKACEVASSAYVVTQQTPTITGGTSVALGGTLTLTGSNTGASWTSSNTSVATVSDGTVSGVSEGAATITYTTTDGCTATKEVSVVDCEAPSVALSSASTSCGLSAAVDLSAFVSSHNGTLSYAVTSGSGTVNASTGAFTAPSSAGATVVRVTATGDGATVCSGTATADITITAANLGYIPGTYHTVACGDIEVINYNTLASADATTSGKWLVNPRGTKTSSRTYTNVSNDANGNPGGITDNIPTGSSVSMATIQEPSTSNYGQNGRYMLHMRVKGIESIIVHGVTGSSGRGAQIFCQEYSESMNAETTFGSAVATMTRASNSGSFILQKTGLDVSKQYLITIAATGGDDQLYAVELVPDECACENVPSITGNLSTTPVEYSVGESATPLSVTATNCTLTYQWYSSTDAIIDNGDALISGATSASYTPSTAAVGETYYYCKVHNNYNGGTDVYSNLAQINVTCEVSNITLSESSTSMKIGKSVDLSSKVSAHNGNLSYTVQSGGSFGTLVGSTFTGSSAGTAVVRITNTLAAPCSGSSYEDYTITVTDNCGTDLYGATVSGTTATAINSDCSASCKNINGGKMSSNGAYVLVTLTDGTYLQDGDVINVNIATPNETSILEITSDATGENVLATKTAGITTGDNLITLTGVSGKNLNKFYLYRRSASSNPVLNSVKLSRECCTAPTTALAITSSEASVVTGGTATISVTPGTGNGNVVSYSASAGTITSEGEFTAPAVATPTVVTITATQAANDKCAQVATVNVNVTPNPNQDIYVSKGGVEVPAGSSIDFSNVEIASDATTTTTETYTFTIEDLGLNDLKINSIVVTGDAFIGGCDGTCPTVSNGNSSSFTVSTVTGLAPGTYNGTVTINSNDPDEAAYTFNIRYVVVPKYAVTVQFKTTTGVDVAGATATIDGNTTSVSTNPATTHTVLVGSGLQTITCTEPTGYRFSRWQIVGGASSSSNEYEFNVTGDMTIRAIYSAEECEEIAHATATSSTEMSASVGSVSVTSPSSTSDQPGDGNAVKLNSSGYVTVTAKAGSTPIAAGDSIIVTTWAKRTSKTHGYYLHTNSSNGNTASSLTNYAVTRGVLDEDCIESDGTVKVFRASSDAFIVSVVIKRCNVETVPQVNATITPADNSNNVDVNSNIVVTLPDDFYLGADCEALTHIDITENLDALTDGVKSQIVNNIKIYKFNEGTSSYDDVTGSFSGTAVGTIGTGVTVTFTHDNPMSYTSQYRVEILNPGVSNEICDPAVNNISTFITGEEPLPQITVKDNGDVTTFPNGGSLNVVNLMPADEYGDAVIKIYNTGTASGTLDISSMTITGDNASMFSIQSCTVGGASDMTPSLTKGGDPAVVTIRFTKESGIGTYHAILNIASNSTTDAAFALNLIGTKIDFELPYVYESGCTDPVADPALGVRQDYTREGDVPSEITIGAGAEDSGVDANVIPHYSLWSSLGGCSQNGESAIRVGDKKDGKAIHINTGGKAIGKITVKWAANGLRKIFIENAAGVPFAQSLGWEASNECHTTTAFINDCDKAGGTGTSEAYIRVYGPEDGAMAAISYLEITPCDPEIKSSACELINVESANQQETAPGKKVPYTAQGTDGFIAVTDNCEEGGTFTPTTLTVSNGATISPKVGVAQTINAQGYVTYVVTAADAMTKKEYHVYPECQPVLDNSKCYASEITINSTNGGNIYKTTGEDKKIAVVATASDPGEACGVVMIDGNANGANHTVHYLDQDDIPDGGYKIEGPKSVCVGSTGTYRITNAPESNSPIYTWYLPHPNEAGFAVVGSEIAYDAAFTTALSAKFTPNASGYYKPQEVGEMLGIGQFVTATVSVEVSKDVFENRLMDIFSGPELKLLAPNVIESGDVSVALSLNFDFEDANCRLLSGVASYSIKATSRSATPIVSVDAGCADENNRLVLTASQGSGVDVIEATKLDWTFSDPDVNILVASGNSVTVNIGKGAPDIYATVIASNGCGTTDPNPTPIAVPYGTPATTWIGKDDNNWNNPANWTRQVPTACTDVTIAAVGETLTLPKGGNTTVSTYPSINGSDEGVCDEITFNCGAGVKGLEKLSYRRAYVKNAYRRNQWYTLTNPLKEMVSGDYYFNGVPLTYMRKFDVTHSESGVTYTQKWTKEYNGLNEPLAAGQGFAYQVTSRNMKQVDNPSAGDQEVIFPRMTVDSLLITELHKFNPLTGKLLLASVNLTKTENSYRFAYDGASVSEGVKTPTKSDFGNTISVPITAGAGKYSLIGNPMMCHLNLAAFLTANESVIEPEALFWNGETNHNVEITKGGTVATAAQAAEMKIAPMQGFFVKNKGNGTSVTFNVADHFVTDNGTYNLRSADASSDGTLYVTGNDGKTTSYLSVRKIEGASNGFAEGEDAEKIFNAYAVSEISTLAGGVATDINHFSALPYETPLAVNTTADKDTVDLTFKGAESFENVNVTLVNKKTGEEINLKDENKYKFIFTKDEAETTLVLRFASDEEITTDAEQAEADASGCDVQIFTKGNNTVRVMSSSSNQIREVSIYDAAGKLIAKEVATGNGVTVMDKVLNAGARNVVVTAVTDNCVKTEILQLK